MEFRHPTNPKDAKHYTTDRLRGEYLIQDLFSLGNIKKVYSHVDRIIVMGACPSEEALTLGEDMDVWADLGATYFLERRELGTINVGGPGKVIVDGETYIMSSGDGLYVAMGAKEVKFVSDSKETPAKFYTLSTPAHKAYKNVHIDITKAKQVPLGSAESCNKRTIYQYIHPEVLESCQLLMGLTKMDVGNVWNTMPAHTHERRMEVYFYFNLPEDAALFHYMGEPQETRHIVMKNEEAVISPSWSIHSGCGTNNYNFIWGMAGENQAFTDMDHIEVKNLK